jgi:hypothetical protein
MSHQTHIPDTVNASLEARLSPFHRERHAPPAHPEALEDLDAEASRAVTPAHERRHLSLLPSLKLLFASLGAGNSVVPMGDNSRAARLLAEYANTLRTN